MANHISHAGIPFPVYRNKYTVVIPYLDADGDPVDPTSPDTEISKDGGAFADCVEEVTTITGGNGVGFITLTATEMQAGTIVLAAKSANAKTTILVLNTYRMVDISAQEYFISGGAGTTSHFYVNPADVATAFGTQFIRMEGLWISMRYQADNTTFAARPITEYHPDTGEIYVAPSFEIAPGNLESYAFGFPVGTGTVLEQVTPTQSGGFIR